MIKDPRFKFIENEPAPRLLVEATKLYGTVEVPGPGDSPVILGWADEVGLEKVYVDDATAWCGLFVAVCVKRAGFEPIADPLWARNWARWGRTADQPSLGDVLVFRRGSGGHVGIYVGEDVEAYYVLGGNQSDQVNITRVAKGRLIAARRCPWRVMQPANVRPIHLAAAGGALSTNEA
jgi:uncharacterized protein (TIGR02594 family)